MNTKTLVDTLNKIVADTYVVLMQTQDAHWNATGSNFYAIHKMTQEQYEDMFEAIDLFAERIRAKGHPAPSGMATYTKLASVKHADLSMLNCTATIQHLIDANQGLCKTLAEGFQACEQEGDQVTGDMINDRLAQHEKFIWLLNATISGSD